MAQLSEILAIMSRLGVRDPNNPSAKDFKVGLDAYLKDKSLDTEAFNTYVKSLPTPLKVMCEGFAQSLPTQERCQREYSTLSSGRWTFSRKISGERTSRLMNGGRIWNMCFA